MTTVDDEFDLDLRLSFGSREPAILHVGGRLGAEMADTVPPEATCPDDTCSLGCLTQTCPDETCGCNTAETCDQQLEGCGGIFTFGPYCEDQSDGCGDGPGGTADCPDPPDVDPGPHPGQPPE